MKEFTAEIIFSEMKKTPTICLGVFFALCTCIGASLHYFEALFPVGVNLLSLAGAVVVLAVAAVFYIAVIAAALVTLDYALAIRSIRVNVRSGLSNLKQVQYCSLLAGLILVCWTPYVCCAWPGNIHGDFIYELMQYKGSMPLTNHHPIMITFIYGFLYSIGEGIGGGNCGIALVMCAQVALMLFVVVYSVMTYLRWGRGVPSVAIAFFALNPIIPMYATFCVKDVPSTAAIALFLLTLGDLLIKSNSKTHIGRPCWAKVLVFSILASLMRNSNVFIVIAALIVLLLTIQKCDRGKAASVMLLSMALVGAWTYLVVPSIGAESGSVREALSIPLQQTAAYCKLYPDELTAEEESAVKDILPDNASIDDLGSRYTFKISDPVKSYVRFDSTNELLSYMRSWLSMGLKHPGLYATVFLHGNYGYWYPFLEARNVKWGNTFDLISNEYIDSMLHSGFKVDGGAESLLTVKPYSVSAVKAAKTFIDYIQEIPPFSFTARPAWYFAAMAVLGVWSLTRKKKLGPIFAPFILLFAICCASPDYSNMRYVVPIVVCLPTLLSLCMVSDADGDAAEQVREPAR